MSHLVIANRRIENAAYFHDPLELEAYLKLHPEIDTLIFVLWSWIVEAWMLDAYKCYGMHTGPLLEGKGRGGSPIDNLKALGVKVTTLCAFEMTEKLDQGRVVLAIPIRIDQPKEYIIGWIDGFLPRMVEYLTAPKSDIPTYFKRLPDAQ